MAELHDEECVLHPASPDSTQNFFGAFPPRLEMGETFRAARRAGLWRYRTLLRLEAGTELWPWSKVRPFSFLRDLIAKASAQKSGPRAAAGPNALRWERNGSLKGRIGGSSMAFPGCPAGGGFRSRRSPIFANVPCQGGRRNSSWSAPREFGCAILGACFGVRVPPLEPRSRLPGGAAPLKALSKKPAGEQNSFRSLAKPAPRSGNARRG